MYSFLDSVIPKIPRQRPNCQQPATANNPVTVRALLYDGWTCSCGEEHAGALADPDLIPVMPQPDDQVEEKIDELTGPAVIKPPEKEPADD